MDYEHLYAYLDTRPLNEIKACMIKVVNLVRKHSGDLSASNIDTDIDEEEFAILTANQRQSKSRRCRIAQRIWTHQAVFNKFGSRSKDIISPTQASEAISDLIVLPQVVEYMMSINSWIDNEMQRESDSSNKVKLPEKTPRKYTSTPFPTNSSISRNLEPQEPAKTPKRARASTPIASKPSFDDRTVGSSDVSGDEETELWVDGNTNTNNNVGDTPGTSASSSTTAATPHGTSNRPRTVWTKEMVCWHALLCYTFEPLFIPCLKTQLF